MTTKKTSSATVRKLCPQCGEHLHTRANASVCVCCESKLPHCKTCGSAIVATINDSVFGDGECNGCEYRRYKLQPEFAEALDRLLEQTVDQDLAYDIELTEGEKEARAKSLAVFEKLDGNAA